MDKRPVTFLPGLFRPKPGQDKEDADDPFVSEEVLQEYCGLFAPDGIPNNIRHDPYVAQIIKFSDEELNDIKKAHAHIDIRQTEEEEKKKKKQAAVEKSKKKPDNSGKKIFEDKAYYLKKACPVKIPYKSSLTHEEHAAYLQAFYKFSNKATKVAAETTEYENYLRLQHRVFEEQTNFMQFSYQVARLEIGAYNTVPEAITKYIEEYVQHRCKRASKYPEHYTTEQQVPICPQYPENIVSKLSFTHVGHVLSLGTLPQFIVPNKARAYTLKIDDSVFKREHLARGLVHDINVLHDTPVSGDRNAEYLAQQHQANIVISTSAMKVLADNHGPNFDKEWDIPVEVKSYTLTDSDGKQSQQRVVYIDKPMPKKIWTPLEKKQLYFKKAALATLTEIRRAKNFKLQTPALFQYSEGEKSTCDIAPRPVAEYGDNFLDLSDTADTDVFGSEATEQTDYKPSPKKRKVPERSANKSPDSAKLYIIEKKAHVPEDRGCLEGTDEDEHEAQPVKDPSSEKQDNAAVDAQDSPKQEATQNNSGNFLDDLLNMQDSLLKPSLSLDDKTEDQSKEASTSSRTPMRPWTKKIHTDWKNVFEPHICPDWTGKNVHYQLFSLGLDSCHPATNLQPIRVLVRSNLHGLSHFKSSMEKCKAYVAYPKIENQAYFGCEVSTLSEITQQWIQLLVRPNTALLHLRVCNSSGEVLMSESKDLPEILRDGKQQHVGFSPYQPLATLYSVFSAVLGQPTGHYLLHHDPKTKAFIQLMKAADPHQETYTHIYNLHKAYAAASVTTRQYSAPPWLAIDTHVLTPFHKKHKKIPGTFPMNNPNKKLTASDKKKITLKAKNKKSLKDLEEEKEELTAF